MLYETVIIGGGISGVMALRQLERAGLNAILLERRPYLGGRMASRGDNGYTYDFGAHSFCADDAQFAKIVQEWQNTGIARLWRAPNMFTGRGQIRKLVEELGAGLPVHTGQKVTGIECISGEWQVQMEDKSHYRAESVILALPIPQALALLDNSSADIDRMQLQPLEEVRYSRKISMLVRYDEMDNFPEHGIIETSGEPIEAIVFNKARGISQKNAVTIHVGTRFSAQYWQMEKEAVARSVLHMVNDWMEVPFREYHLHRWGYARVTEAFDGDGFVIRYPGLLGFTGDAFAGGDIQGAVLSAGFVASEIIQRI
jgi:renalase